MPSDAEELGFEEALAQLEQIVAELEAGQLSLQEALERFEQGMVLKEFCEQQLAEAEARIEQYVAPERPIQEEDGDMLSQ